MSPPGEASAARPLLERVSSYRGQTGGQLGLAQRDLAQPVSAQVTLLESAVVGAKIVACHRPIDTNEGQNLRFGATRTRANLFAVTRNRHHGRSTSVMAHDAILVWGEQPGVAVVLLSGEQEAYSAPKLEAQLAPLLEEGIGVVVDLSPTTFVDSATLLVLLKARKRAEERRVGFALQMGDSTGASVRRTFEITRLNTIFPISRTRAEAIEIARAGRSAEPGMEQA